MNPAIGAVDQNALVDRDTGDVIPAHAFKRGCMQRLPARCDQTTSPGSQRRHSRALQLVPILLQRDAHQLTSRSHTRFGEELL